MLTFTVGLTLALTWLSAAGWLGRQRRHVAMVAMVAVAGVCMPLGAYFMADWSSWLRGVALGALVACVINVALLRQERRAAQGAEREGALTSR